ncbi:hypothetical protein [Pelagibius sp. 7325]|uniref:hypothetical protein n=1 Tax=Pelagibius sp. 7325 TaxID=3131994 RepID=UPI0030EEB42A
MHHLVLATGDCWWSPKAKIPRGVVRRFRPVVRAGGGRLDDTEWFVRMLPDTLPGTAAFECHYGGPQWQGGQWVGSCYMAWTQSASKKMWEVVLKHEPLVKPGLQCPASPWLAGALTPKGRVTLSPEHMFQLCDLERCVGWAVREEAATRKAA